MSLSDIMRHADLTLYPKVAMVIFLAVFLLVVRRVMLMNRHTDLDRLARLALEDDAPAPTNRQEGEAR